MSNKMGTWNKKTLDDVCTQIYSGGTPKRKEPSFWDGNFPWLASGETKNSYIKSTNETITEEGIKKSSTRLAYKNSIVMASAGQGYTRGQVSYLMIDTYINQSVICLVADNSIIDSKFLFFNLKNRYDELRKVSDDNSIRGSITTKMLKNLEINLPSLSEQKSIANILSSLDEKVENNTAIIANLEKQAQAIFKSWFVDFEPFQEGEFVESELGLIPLGWDVSTLDKLAQINMGQSPKSEYYNTIGEGYPFMQGNTTFGVKFGTIEKYTEQSNRISNYKDILLSVRAPVGDMNINIINNLAIGRGLTSIKPQKNLHGYVYSYLKHFLNRIIAKGTGTVFSSINKKDLTSFQILLPKDEKLLSVFVEMSNNFLDQQICLELENRKLTETRDILLPKLMSREIRVEDTIEVKEM